MIRKKKMHPFQQKQQRKSFYGRFRGSKKCRFQWESLQPYKPHEQGKKKKIFIVSDIPFWTWTLKDKDHFELETLPQPYVLELPVDRLDGRSSFKEESKRDSEWFVYTKETVWKCYRVTKGKYVSGIQNAWLTSFLSEKGIFPPCVGTTCIQEEKHFSIAVGTQRYTGDLYEITKKKAFQNLYFLKVVLNKCLYLILKLASPEVGVIYVDFKPHNVLVLLKSAYQWQEVQIALIDADPKFVILCKGKISKQRSRQILGANLFFFYINFWSLIDHLEFAQQEKRNFQELLHQKVHSLLHPKSLSHYYTVPLNLPLRGLMTTLLSDMYSRHHISPLSVLHRYLFFNLDSKDTTSHIILRLHKLKKIWPADPSTTESPSKIRKKKKASLIQKRRDVRRVVYHLVDEIIRCSGLQI